MGVKEKVSLGVGAGLGVGGKGDSGGNGGVEGMGAVRLGTWVMGVLALGVVVGSSTVLRSDTGFGFVGFADFLWDRVEVAVNVQVDGCDVGTGALIVGALGVLASLSNTRATLAASGEDGGLRVVIWLNRVARSDMGVGSGVWRVALENRLVKLSRT